MVTTASEQDRLRSAGCCTPSLAQITATGEVWEMRDAYGTRIALIAGFSYPDGVDRSVFLFYIDACGFSGNRVADGAG